MIAGVPESIASHSDDFKSFTCTVKNGKTRVIAAKLKEIPLTEAMGQEAKSLKSDIDTLNKSVQSLKERFNVYYGKLKDLKADVSDLAI